MTKMLGPVMVLLFCLSQAFRDVYLGHVFQNVDFFAVILLAFIPSTLFFGALSLWRTPGDVKRLRGQGATLLAMNITTAMAWTSYFFGLTHLEPAVVNTLHSGVGPLTVIVMGAMGLQIAGNWRTGRLEGLFIAAMGLTLAGLWWVVLSGESGLANSGLANSGLANSGFANSGFAGGMSAKLPALCLLIVSGAAITISHLYAKRMHEAKVSAETVTAVRYGFIMILAAGFLWFRQTPTGLTSIGHAAWLGIAAALLIALPLYALQIGVAHTSQLTAHVLRALGPVFVFALEQFDRRLELSLPVLALILLYSVFITAASVARGWDSVRDRRKTGGADGRPA